MNAEQLKAMQAPIKAKYKENPAAAIVTLRAQGRIGEDIACRVETGKALVACAGVTRPRSSGRN